MTDLLYSDPDLVQFYDIENEGGVDFDYCVGFAKDAGSVLDLGCGTGQLAAALADRRSVTGVDPAPAMLDVARRRAGGQRVDWVEADARNVRLGRRFDLVILTGHAFQVFLTPEDREAVLATIAVHLAADGCFIFDTRNPVAQEWLEWTPEWSQRELSHPELGMVRAWNDFGAIPLPVSSPTRPIMKSPTVGGCSAPNRKSPSRQRKALRRCWTRADWS
ncbi:class I SAM-dependent methyltransferase, partial [Mesorhizobium sp.]|uniref:class I SAM-dependent methyltransferase n=1 Tax=Mesorhizobium sp. TaxID=1871066 RepID=UPI0011FF12D7